MNDEEEEDEDVAIDAVRFLLFCNGIVSPLITLYYLFLVAVFKVDAVFPPSRSAHSDISAHFDHWNIRRRTEFKVSCRITVTGGSAANRSRQTCLVCVSIPRLSTVQNH